MALKKGQKIWVVYIDKGIVTAFTKDMTAIQLTRSQRNALTGYNKSNYIETICKEFCHKEPLHREFSIMKDGTLVFTLDQGLT
jgi:hypothetical protein